MRRLSILTLLAAFSVASFAIGAGTRATIAVFTDPESAPGASYTTIGCFTNDAAAPTIPSTIVAKTTPYLGGRIRQGMAYYVYANVTAGSGGAVERVSADVRSVTAGQFLVPLAAGSYSVGGVSYGYRSAALTAGSPLAPGGYNYSVSAGDVNKNCRTATSSVTIDHTAPVPTDIQAVNGGPRTAEPDEGDTVTYTFSEVIDPQSISNGWTGASRNVVVRISASATRVDDMLTVWDATNTVQLPFGSVDLNANFVVTATTFGTIGTPSTMVQSGNSIIVTLGTLSSGEGRKGSKAELTWIPSAVPYDIATNASTTAPVTESGTSDSDF